MRAQRRFTATTPSSPPTCPAPAPEIESRRIRENLRNDVDRFLADHGLERSDIRAWISHTGGPKILSAIHETLELPHGALDPSWEQLKTVGNVSSASVLQVLKKTIDYNPQEDGAYGLMLTLGPGFCNEMVLLRWREGNRKC